MKTTLLVAFEVDIKYSASDIKKEIEHFIPFLDSELFDTLTSIQAPRTYILWSESKTGASTYTELVAAEKQANGSMSSRIESADIDHLLNAVYNETDIDLNCREVISA